LQLNFNVKKSGKGPGWAEKAGQADDLFGSGRGPRAEHEGPKKARRSQGEQ